MLSTQPDQGLQKQAQPTTMSPSRAEPSPSAADASGGGGGTCWSRCVLIVSYVFLIPRPNKLLVDSSDKRRIKPLIIIFREMTGQKVTSSPTRTSSRLQAVNGPRPRPPPPPQCLLTARLQLRDVGRHWRRSTGQ